MLDRKNYFVREHVGMLKLHEAYDILDPETGDLIGSATEQASSLKKISKLLVNKKFLPFHIDIADAEGNTLLVIRRGFTFLRSKVDVMDAHGKLIGFFKQRLMTIGGKFGIYSAQEELVAELKGNLIGWDFKFIDKAGQELGYVTKKWAGAGKELFTTADNYMVSLTEDVDRLAVAPLLLAAAICVDLVLKEK